jgi:hypothetical protein
MIQPGQNDPCQIPFSNDIFRAAIILDSVLYFEKWVDFVNGYSNLLILSGIL